MELGRVHAALLHQGVQLEFPVRLLHIFPQGQRRVLRAMQMRDLAKQACPCPGRQAHLIRPLTPIILAAGAAPDGESVSHLFAGKVFCQLGGMIHQVAPGEGKDLRGAIEMIVVFRAACLQKLPQWNIVRLHGSWPTKGIALGSVEQILFRERGAGKKILPQRQRNLTPLQNLLLFYLRVGIAQIEYPVSIIRQQPEDPAGRRAGK